MIFSETRLPGAFVIELEKHEDERGFFARTFCEREFARHGLALRYPQCNVSYNRAAHTLRGLHYQVAPHAEAKLVRCTSGAILDVIVDLRAGSPTRLGWLCVELSRATGRSLYVPEGFAHGFLTLVADTEVTYQMSAPFDAGAGRGLRWDDPVLGITWPFRPAVISQRDSSYPDLDPEKIET